MPIFVAQHHIIYAIFFVTLHTHFKKYKYFCAIKFILLQEMHHKNITTKVLQNSTILQLFWTCLVMSSQVEVKDVLESSPQRRIDWLWCRTVTSPLMIQLATLWKMERIMASKNDYQNILNGCTPTWILTMIHWCLSRWHTTMEAEIDDYKVD